MVPGGRHFGFRISRPWVSLLAMVFLGAEIVIQLFINPNLEESLNLYLWECILVAVVAFYFGVRGG